MIEKKTNLLENVSSIFDGVKKIEKLKHEIFGQDKF